MMVNGKEGEIIEELSITSRYQIELETLKKGSDFIFDCFNLLQYECYRLNFKLGGSFGAKCSRMNQIKFVGESCYKKFEEVCSLDWIKNKKTTINSVNIKDHKCFHTL